MRREPFQIECDRARRARLRVQLVWQLRERPPDRGQTEAPCESTGKGAPAQVQMPSHSSSTK